MRKWTGFVAYDHVRRHSCLFEILESLTSCWLGWVIQFKHKYWPSKLRKENNHRGILYGHRLNVIFCAFFVGPVTQVRKIWACLNSCYVSPASCRSILRTWDFPLIFIFLALSLHLIRVSFLSRCVMSVLTSWPRRSILRSRVVTCSSWSYSILARTRK